MGHNIEFLAKNIQVDKILKDCQIECTNNGVNKQWKDYRIKCTDDELDKKLKEEVTLLFDVC